MFMAQGESKVRGRGSGHEGNLKRGRGRRLDASITNTPGAFFGCALSWAEKPTTPWQAGRGPDIFVPPEGWRERIDGYGGFPGSFLFGLFDDIGPRMLGIWLSL